MKTKRIATHLFRLRLGLLSLALAATPTSAPAADNPFAQAAAASFAGRFVGPEVTLRLKPEGGQLAGSLLFRGRTFAIQGENKDGQLVGTFGQDASAFTATSDGDRLTFTAGTFKSVLIRQKLPPLAGVFVSKRVKLEFQNQNGGLNGTLELNGKSFPFTAKEAADELAGVFKSGADVFQFTVFNDPAGLTFQSDTFAEVIRAQATSTGAKSGAAGGPAAFENSLGMKFVKVPGTEVMFCIWETRVRDYEAFVTAMSYQWDKPSFDQGPTHPAVNVSWDDAKLFCTWLTKTERKAGRIQDDQIYRLPTDAEWSVAVGLSGESGSTAKEKNMKIRDVYPWGTAWPPPAGAGNYADMTYKLKSSTSASIEGYDDDFAGTSPVGSFKANALGLYDLGGNVWEWCEDWCDSEHKYRVLRGASWVNDDRGGLLSSSRGGNPPGYRSGNCGFRVVLVDSTPADE